MGDGTLDLLSNSKLLEALLEAPLARGCVVGLEFPQVDVSHEGQADVANISSKSVPVWCTTLLHPLARKEVSSGLV